LWLGTVETSEKVSIGKSTAKFLSQKLAVRVYYKWSL